MLQEAIDQYEQKFRALTPEEKEKFASPAYLKAERQRARVLSLSRTSGTALDVLSAKGLFFARTARNRSFLLGSFPVMKLTPIGRSELSDPEVEVWFAIDPNVAIILASNNTLKPRSVHICRGGSAHQSNNREAVKDVRWKGQSLGNLHREIFRWKIAIPVLSFVLIRPWVTDRPRLAI